MATVRLDQVNVECPLCGDRLHVPLTTVVVPDDRAVVGLRIVPDMKNVRAHVVAKHTAPAD